MYFNEPSWASFSIFLVFHNSITILQQINMNNYPCVFGACILHKLINVKPGLFLNMRFKSVCYNLHKNEEKYTLKLFIKKWANPGLFFVYFHYFLITVSIIQIEKSLDGVLGIRTRGRRMVSADKTTELRRPPLKLLIACPI